MHKLACKPGPIRLSLGFRIQGLGFRVWGLGFRVKAGGLRTNPDMGASRAFLCVSSASATPVSYRFKV